jgi:hypothetical protein
MGDRYFEGFPLIACATQVDIFGDELLVGVAEKRSRQEMGFAEDLEAVADAEHLSAFRGEPGYALHNGAEAGNCPAAEVVAIGKTPGKNDAVVFAQAAQIGILVPEHDNFLIQIGLQGTLHITIAVRSGENHYAEFHGHLCLGYKGTKRAGLLKIVHE